MNTDKQLPVIERNFHILNDDRFIMEKISLPVEQQEGEDIHAALNRTRETIVQNFKAAYPKVYTHLNFDATIQRDEKLWNEYVTKPAFEKHFNIKLPTDAEFDERNDNLKLPTTIPNDKATWQVSQSDEKINKGTIEEQIQASKDLAELDGWKFIAKSNTKLQEIFNNRETQLINEAVK